MKRIIVSVFVIGLLTLLVVGCNEGKKPDEQATTPSGDTSTYQPDLNPADFVSTIDNKFLPLSPGTTLVYEGDTGEGIEHIEVVVTNETKEILGITCVVVRDTVTMDGQVVEDTYDWFAQDKDGNVWYFGEDSKEYENGKVVSTKGSWEASVDGAQPGIIMKAKPVVGEEYRQEYYKGEAEDMAEVKSLNESVSVKTGTYDGCLKTYEWTPLEPDLKEYKYYAPGTGMVLETQLEDESLRIKLIEIKKG